MRTPSPPPHTHKPTLFQNSQVCLTSQCPKGDLKPELYKAGAAAMALGVEAGPQMTSECAVTKLMICLAYPDLPLGVPLAGEL